MALSPRDHSLALNPFLQSALDPTNQPVYWVNSTSLATYSESGTPHTVKLEPTHVTKWLADHDVDDLWSPWASLLSGQRFLIEHTSVNPVHPLHVGSMRSTVIGNGLARLLRSGGADVEVRYFVNDRGRQVHLMAWIAAATQWTSIPSDLRTDDAVGVLYALANMITGSRSADIARLTTQHSWLALAVDIALLRTQAGAAGASVPLVMPELVDNAASELVRAMIRHAEQDMGHFGAAIDVYDWESTLPFSLRSLVLELCQRHQTTTVNGTLCLRQPGGLVPLIRPDGSELYFVRDVANTLRRDTSSRTIMHVIGDDQVLLQDTLKIVLPQTIIEHVPFAAVIDRGKKFSARQNRLLTVTDLHRLDGTTGPWSLALGLLLHQRHRKIDVARLTNQPLQQVLAARRAADRSDGVDLHGGLSTPLTCRLDSTMLRTPGILVRALQTRSPHAIAALLVEVSTLYLSTARQHLIQPATRRWFLELQSRLAGLLGMDLTHLMEVDDTAQRARSMA